MRLPKLLASFAWGKNLKKKKRERTSKLQTVFNDFRAECDEREGVPISMRQMIVNWFYWGGAGLELGGSWVLLVAEIILPHSARQFGLLSCDY